MNTEQLLKPRYKVIADWPKSLYHVGDILDAGWRSEDCIYCDTDGPRWRHYPHLFKPLQWWEERKPEDMPEYVKSIKKEYDYGINEGQIVHVKKNQWQYFGGQNRFCYLIKSKWREYHPQNLIPATESEYNEYLKQSKK